MKIEIGCKLLFSTISKVYLVQDIDKVLYDEDGRTRKVDEKEVRSCRFEEIKRDS